MCGRYASAQTDAELAKAFEVVDVVGDEPEPSWNVAPTQQVRAVLERAPKDEPEAPAARLLRSVRWGLVPSWAKDVKVGNKMINARVETLLAKAAFKSAARRRRCVIPADGYYEWMKIDNRKVPFFLHPEDGQPLAMAGLYELRPDPELPEDHPDRWLWTCTVITTTAADTLGHIHDRSPLLIPGGDLLDAWLDPRLDDPDDVQALINSLPEPHLEPYEVSTAVNSVRNNGPHLVDPVTA
ncbi:SOS response-associated peptidase [Kutzneria kofuensis]|uniref:Abasic site processing protein n=1 Tax=Kutzneria kofuensis TaxID=103725 RepID=A0A7W9KQX7_9PSEU|nr:SOS response-associated peptidase [Kutzneria kofuensis]MBB5897071.1 putative SOS response-associated peptidase YedK [Kutzneria kofuensis]